jgi:NAD(P)-dependent dehydrogenase (short-subunit alcohol dehydrogenase family)
MRLKNKVAIVTGGSRGIGRAISIGMAKEGARVVVNYANNSKAAEEVVKEISLSGSEAISIKVDVSKKGSVEDMVRECIKRFGKIDILVNNAGVAPFVDVFDVTEELWDQTMGVNAKGIFFTSQIVAREMVKTGGGKIINVTSISGIKATHPLQVPYCASKAGANMLTKVMALALAPYKINVNAILPGTVETDMSREYLADEVTRMRIINNTALKCLGKPQDIAGAAIYLGSDESNWVTGSLLIVDGGFVL